LAFTTKGLSFTGSKDKGNNLLGSGLRLSLIFKSLVLIGIVSISWAYNLAEQRLKMIIREAK
jgi:hypothetical protein